MEQKFGQSPPPKKTTVNRIFLFFLIGSTTATPLLVFNFVLVAWLSFFLTPLITFAILIVLSRNESRVSEVKPGWLEFFFSALGAFYPSVFVAVILWLVWWVLFGLAVLFGVEGELDGAAASIATVVYNLLSLFFAFFLTRMNWQHVLNQLYPQIGNQSAFAQVSKTGKLWLLRRGILFFVIFIVFLSIYIAIVFRSPIDPGVSLDLSLGFSLVIIYLFFISISAWLWLRKPEIPRSIELTTKAIIRLLVPLGYEVQALSEIKNDSTHEADFSEQMTASVDLVARKENQSLVIDIMTAEETQRAPDWVIASEFRMAVWYLKNILQLPSPVEAVAVLVDVAADDSWYRFSEDQDINVIQLSGDEVLDLVRANDNDQALQKKVISLFSPSIVGSEYTPSSPSNGQVLEDGGRHG